MDFTVELELGWCWNSPAPLCNTIKSKEYVTIPALHHSTVRAVLFKMTDDDWVKTAVRRYTEYGA